MVQEKKIQKKTHWSLVIVVFFFVGLAVDYFFLHILFQEKLKEHQRHEEVQPSATPSPATSPGAEAASVPAASATQEPIPQGNTKDFQDKTRECLGQKLAMNPTPDQLVDVMERMLPIVKTEFQLENTHIQLPDGSQRRLHLIPAENSNSKNARELRYFKLDAEGLPERIELKPDETFNPKSEFLTSLKSQGKVIYTQLKETKTLNDGTSMVLTRINGKVYEFQIFSRGKTLSCRSLKCLCR